VLPEQAQESAQQASNATPSDFEWREWRVFEEWGIAKLRGIEKSTLKSAGSQHGIHEIQSEWRRLI
jgi:hypothetical protein